MLKFRKITMTSATPIDEKAPQKSFAALRHPGARMYLLGSALAMMADNIEHVITYWVIFQKFQSPALAGFAIISHWLPFLLFSFLSGALADRYDPRRIIQLGMLLFMSVSLVWGYLIYTDTLEMWHAAALLIVHGFAGVLWGPASQLLIHEIVGGAQLQSGVRMLATSRKLGILLGPAIGGGLMLLFGPAFGLFINVLIYLPLVIWLWKAPYGKPAEDGEEKQPRRALRGFADILPTLRSVMGDPTIFSMIMLIGAASFFVGAAHQAQMPEFTRDLGYGDTGVYYSLLLAANAAGAVIAGLVLESGNLLEPKPKTAFILVLLWCLTITGFAASTNYTLSLSLLFFSGFLNLAYSSMAQTLVQLRAPQESRGRIIGLYNMANMGMMTFSGLSIGVGGSFIGIHWSLGLSAAALAIVTMGLMVYVISRLGPKAA
jgi:MFS family permease